MEIFVLQFAFPKKCNLDPVVKVAHPRCKPSLFHDVLIHQKVSSTTFDTLDPLAMEDNHSKIKIPQALGQIQLHNAIFRAPKYDWSTNNVISINSTK
ncbi:hypothetical protein F2P81_007549 [Scophthalmus maximus]|uniref:Uncharacterized protein n=1 Tax=Scophthalmus maximus TaxID=52904 RepID=A0A6A4T7Y4_SCOMX|nr:hypothetical protein F2P81_007549 [Scophthalmus maximus]